MRGTLDHREPYGEIVGLELVDEQFLVDRYAGDAVEADGLRIHDQIDVELVSAFTEYGFPSFVTKRVVRSGVRFVESVLALRYAVLQLGESVVFLIVLIGENEEELAPTVTVLLS